MSEPTSLYGLMAEFTRADALVEAAQRAREAGFTKLDAYTPFSVEGLTEALALPPTRVPYAALAGGLIGGAIGFIMQSWFFVFDYPMNIGGRPLFSWQAFLIVTFELTVLGAALASLVAMLAGNRLPMPYHPAFNVSSFARASQDHFFLSIEADDPHFERLKARDFLEGLQPIHIYEVPR